MKIETVKKLALGLVAALALLLVVAVIVRIAMPQGTPDTGATRPAMTQPETTLPATTGDTAPAPEAVEITWKTFPENRRLKAKQAFVYDCRNQSITVVSGSENDRVYPASVTKLFTAHVALQYLKPEQIVTATDALELVGPGSSIARIEKGDTLTVAQLVEAMLLPSGNDAAYLLAVEVGRIIKNDNGLSAAQAKAVFVEQMNREAAVQGMTGTRFENPDGYHQEGHYTTFADLVTIGNLSLQNETLMKYAGVSSDRVTLASGEKQWKNTNALVDPMSEYYCPYTVGLKTGQTPSAGSCLLSAFDVAGVQYIIGVFGCPEEEDRFDDTLQLLNEILGKG